MNKKLHILLLEDSISDAELIIKMINKNGMNSQFKVVDNKQDFVREIQEFEPDLILSDYKVPLFNGLEALNFVRQNFPSIPFIIVTGKLSEETAVDLMKQGAWDYVLKKNLLRLPPVIWNALELKEEKEKKLLAEEALKDSHEIYQKTIKAAQGIPYRFFYGNTSYDFIGAGIETLFGITKEEFTIAKMKELTKETNLSDSAGYNDLQEYELAFRRNEVPCYRADLRIETPNGEEKWISDCAVPIIDKKTNKVIGAMGIMQNISNRKLAEDRIKKELGEKEVLIKEIHHRVKNNLQVICSLLHLQSRRTKDEASLEMFQESQNRVRSIALAYEKLFKSKNLSRIDLSDYIRKLVADLVSKYQASAENVTIDINVDKISLDIDVVVPLGLIINELISNALKYAFPNHWKGERKIYVTLKVCQNNQINLAIKYSGIGIPKKINIRNPETLGLQFVTSLVENQLQGEIELKRNSGTAFNIKLKLNQEII